jgi:hypothetical protein
MNYIVDEAIIIYLSEKCYADNKPKKWKPTYISKAIWRAEIDEATGETFFECPEKYIKWLEKQEDFKKLKIKDA